MDLAGLVLSSVAMSTLFQNCVGLFKTISEGRAMGHDYAILFEQLNMEAVCFADWGEMMGLHNSEAADLRPPLDKVLIRQAVARAFAAIAILLANQKSSRLHKSMDLSDIFLKMDLNHGDDSVASIEDQLLQRRHELEDDIRKARTNATGWRQLRWAISDKSKFQELLRQLHAFNENLHELATRSIRDRLEGDFIARILETEDLEVLQRISTAARFAYHNLSIAADIAVLQMGSRAPHADIEIPRDLMPHALPEDNRRCSFGGDTVPTLVSLWGCILSTRFLVEWRQYEYNMTPTFAARLDENLSRLAGVLNLDLQNAHYSTLKCMGYFKDPFSQPKPRAGFVFAYPAGTDTSSTSTPITLLQALETRDIPALGIRFRIAKALVTAVHRVLASKWYHKSLRAQNVLFFRNSHTGDFDLTQPHILGWDHSRLEENNEDSVKPGENEAFDLYRHDDCVDPALRLVTPYKKQYDIFSLGLLLFEIAIWKPIGSLYQRELREARKARKVPPSIPEFHTNIVEEYTSGLPFRVGDCFSDAVVRCLKCNFGVIGEDSGGHKLLKAFSQMVIAEIDHCMA